MQGLKLAQPVVCIRFYSAQGLVAKKMHGRCRYTIAIDTLPYRGRYRSSLSLPFNLNVLLLRHLKQ